MSRILGAAVLLAIGIASAGCGRERGGLAARGPNAKEFAILPVGVIQVDGRDLCGLLENPPDSIVTHKTGAGQAEWIVVGNCTAADTIAIDPVLIQGGSPRPNMIKVAGPEKVPASHGSRLKVVVLPQAVEGEYEYQVLINGSPAQYASPADRGAFAICPDWPCRRR